MSIRNKLFEAERFAHDATGFLGRAASLAIDGNDYILASRIQASIDHAEILRQGLHALIGDYDDTHPTERGAA